MDSIARPGDYVQFFVEVDSPNGNIRHGRLFSNASLGFTSIFGVGEFGKQDYVPEKVNDSMRAQRQSVGPMVQHFGAYSAEGLYLDMRSGSRTDRTTKTKVDTPGTYIIPMVNAAIGRQSSHPTHEGQAAREFGGDPLV